MRRIPSLRELLETARREHDAVRALATEIQRLDPGGERADGRIDALRQAVLDHARDEEARLFPEAERALQIDELERLGEELRARKQRLLLGPVGRIKRALARGLRPVA